MVRLLLLGATLVGVLLTTGCASVVNGHNQSVSVTTQSKGADVAGAKCTLTNDKGVWYLTTPGSVDVHRSYGDMAVACKLAGLDDGIAAVTSATTAAVFGNILVGGVIGAGVDVATGAAYNYPNVIPIVMGRTTIVHATQPDAPGASAKSPAPPLDPAMASARVPYLNDAQQAHYRIFLTRPLPRAFAFSSNGHYAAMYTNSPYDKSLPSDPRERALLVCGRLAGIPCQLFAVDDQIVYQETAAPPTAAAAVAHTRLGSYPADPVLVAKKVPHLNDGQQAEYQAFLTHPLPRAFAISDNGHFAMAWSNASPDPTMPADPKDRALIGCKRFAGRDCTLYVVDNTVVYPEP
jgi:hypothetical protein